MRRLSPTVVTLIFFILLDSMAFYVAYVKRNINHVPVAMSGLAPEITWKAFDGSSHTLKDLAGHVVVLHFWAAWCPPCRQEFPRLLKAAADNPDTMFLTISSDDTLDKPEQFVKEMQSAAGTKSPKNVLYAWDPSRTITYDQFLTISYPETIFIDGSGHMRRKVSAPLDWSNKGVKEYLQELRSTK